MSPRKRPTNPPTVPVKAKKRGRPESIPWSVELPRLVEERLSGMTYTDMADQLNDRYNKTLSSQTVRNHVDPYLTKKDSRAHAKAREAERAAIDTEDARRLGTWLLDHPAATRREAAEALNMPVYRTEHLMPLVREMFNGYLIPPMKPGREQFSEEHMLDAIRLFVKEAGIGKREPVSQYQYGDWRKNQEPSLQEQLPSPIAFRRRFGTWSHACELAGFHANPLPRSYDGLSTEDIVLWIAHWLRSLSDADRGLVDASQGEYRLWLREHPDAPSEELVRLRGTWSNLLSAASVLERTVKRLPKPKPVGTDGRIKKSLNRRRSLSA